MASISYSGKTSTSVKITISGLSNPFNTSYFKEAGVTDKNFTNGTSSLPGDIIESKSASSSGSSTSVSFTVSGLSPDTSYSWYGYTQAKNGFYYYVGKVSFTTDPEELLEPYISGYTTTSTSIELEFDDLDDCPYIQVMYRKSGSSSVSYEPTNDYKKLTTSRNTITLTDLEPGETYVISFRYSVDGESPDGTVQYRNITTDSAPSDNILVNGVYGLWHSYYEYTGYKWSKTSLTFEIKFSGGYPFHSSYFIEAGITNKEFITSSTTKPSNVLATVTAENPGLGTVEITVSGLSAGSLLSAYLYVKTINGTYVPIPFGNIVGICGKYVATKPNSLSYTSGHVPAPGVEINLLASDIQKFIRGADCVSRWMFDLTSCGIDIDKVVQGKPIYASTYIDFYEFIDQVRDKISFTNVFSITNIAKDKPIAASDLNNLVTALNNMLNAIP